jgi:hypothetical protein
MASGGVCPVALLLFISLAFFTVRFTGVFFSVGGAILAILQSMNALFLEMFEEHKESH